MGTSHSEQAQTETERRGVAAKAGATELQTDKRGVAAELQTDKRGVAAKPAQQNKDIVGQRPQQQTIESLCDKSSVM